MKISENLIAVGTPIKVALEQLEYTAIKFLIMVSSDGDVSGCLTDGDIRRALINGLNVNEAVDTIAQMNPVTVTVDEPADSILEKFRSFKIDVLIQVDEQNRPVCLLTRKTFTKTIFLSPPHMGSEETNFIKRAFTENFIAPTGSNLKDFEQRMTFHSGKKFTLATSSGTAAIHLALRALNVTEGDRVYCSDYTFAGSAHPILYQQAHPVFIDCDPNNWNMCPEALDKALNLDAKIGKLPKAIIVVHIYGQPARISELVSIADSFNVPIIEDCAESLGAQFDGKPSGSHGVLAVYSFNGNKIITTSGGGLLATNDENIIHRISKLASQGREGFYHYEHCELGYNYRMSNVLAGIGLGQLEVLKSRVSKRRLNFTLYSESLAEIPGLSFQTEIKQSLGNRWLTVLKIGPSQISMNPRIIFENLKEIKIESRPAWKPMHMQPLFSDYELVTINKKTINSRDLYFQSICLPSGSELTEFDIDLVCSQIKKTFYGAQFERSL